MTQHTQHTRAVALSGGTGRNVAVVAPPVAGGTGHVSCAVTSAGAGSPVVAAWTVDARLAGLETLFAAGLWSVVVVVTTGGGEAAVDFAGLLPGIMVCPCSTEYRCERKV